MQSMGYVMDEPEDYPLYDSFPDNDSGLIPSSEAN